MENRQLLQIKAMSHPIRMDILKELGRRKQPTPIKDIAEVLQQPPAKLHYHFKQLEKADFIKVAETREINGITEGYYVCTGESDTVSLSIRENPEAVGAALPLLERRLTAMVRRLELIRKQENHPCLFGSFRELELTAEEACKWRDALAGLGEGKTIHLPPISQEGTETYDLAIFFVPKDPK